MGERHAEKLKISTLVMISAALLLSACNGKATPPATEAPAVAEVANTQEPQAQVEMLAYPYPVLHSRWQRSILPVPTRSLGEIPR